MTKQRTVPLLLAAVVVLLGLIAANGPPRRAVGIAIQIEEASRADEYQLIVYRLWDDGYIDSKRLWMRKGKDLVSGATDWMQPIPPEVPTIPPGALPPR